MIRPGGCKLLAWPTPPVAVTSEPLDADALVALVGAHGDGAVVTFAGLVRDHNQGRRVSSSNTRRTSRSPCARFSASSMRHAAVAVGVAWRCITGIGRLEIGDASIVIAAASAHRADAFAACRYTIERVKQIVPIWKREHFDGGDVWLEGATADPDDEAAREKAYRIACA